jgi:hypothetical protein
MQGLDACSDELERLEEWLQDHDGIPEHRPGRPGASLWPLRDLPQGGQALNQSGGDHHARPMTATLAAVQGEHSR